VFLVPKNLRFRENKRPKGTYIFLSEIRRYSWGDFSSPPQPLQDQGKSALDPMVAIPLPPNPRKPSAESRLIGNLPSARPRF
jgi:hypothetical protein